MRPAAGVVTRPRTIENCGPAIVRLNPDFLNLRREWLSRVDTGNGQFDRPEGTGVDGSGDIYVADYNNHRMQKFK